MIIKWLETVKILLNWIKKLDGWWSLKASHVELKNKVWWICVILVNRVEIVITKHVGSSLND
jgi:hypothetical protein